MNASPRLLRPLGPCEMYSSSRHALGFYKCVANTCRYSVPLATLGGHALRDVLEAAVANIVLAFPSLSVGIAAENTSKPHFVQQLSIDLEHHVEYLERAETDPDTRDSALLSLLEDQHDQSWPDIEHRPPWKLIIVVWDQTPGSGLLLLDVVFAVHHSLADGRSTALFHTKLLDELNNPTGRPSQLSGRILDTKNLDKLVQPQEELVKFTASWSFLGRTLWRELGPRWLQGQQPTVPWTGKPITREPCRTRLRLVTVPAVATPHVLDACRANQITLTPLLHALSLASLARRVPAEQAQAFRGATPIDLRPFIDSSSQPEPGKKPFGVFVTGQFHTFDASTIATLREAVADDKIWGIAAELRRDMKQHLETVPKDDIIGMLGWVSDWRQFWLSKVGKPRLDTWEVSNLGSMVGGHGPGEQATEGWKIQRSIMSQGASVAGAVVYISVAGVTGGDLSLALGWQEGIVDEEMVTGLAEDLQIWLDRLGRNERLIQN
ncbi:hypothetical protein VTI74DRAFT_9652 [Chaetomium olivicolor]